MVDTKHLIAEVAARNGIRIDSDDPALCLVTLNELVLEEVVQKVVGQIRSAARDFEDATEKVQRRVGMIVAQQINEAVVTAKLQFDEEIAEVSLRVTERLGKLQQIHIRFAAHWVSAGILSALVIFVVGMLVGMALH